MTLIKFLTKTLMEERKKLISIFITVLFLSLQTLVAQNDHEYKKTLFKPNYDESKILPYNLPELMQTQGGEQVSTIEEWEKVRRPEILKLFEDNVYGQVPKEFDKIKFKIINKDKKAIDGKATFKLITITVYRNQKSVIFNLLMFIPNNIKKPVPTFLVINHRGIKTMDITRKKKDGFWPAEQVIEAGYGIAGIDVKYGTPETPIRFAQTVQEIYPEQTGTSNGIAVLGAWGWGASRAIDYFEKDNSVDAKKIILVGHSRGGKASLWCGAQDERVAITISNDSGNSGAAISRRKFGETISRITTSVPGWFCPNYLQYSDNEDKLPIDQHMLIALMAPRVVYVSSAEKDLWADPKGQYLALFESQPVFDLYESETNLPIEMPEVDLQIIRPNIGFHNRKGSHNMTPYDWQQFIIFANIYFNKLYTPKKMINIYYPSQ
jgi:hypothetical protein